MNSEAPSIEIVNQIAKSYLTRIFSVERVPQGCSTYVYRIETNRGKFYARFQKDEGSFAAEVLVHTTLHSAEIAVPEIVAYEERNELTGRSVMIVREIQGNSVDENDPKSDLPKILREAGKQLATIHTIPVDGFGWIIKESGTKLQGNKLTFDEYFTEFLASDLKIVEQYRFSDSEKVHIAKYIEISRKLLHVENAVLVHGDYDISHIFHSSGNYTGLIDFGEIRGNNRLFDLATFIGFYQNRDNLHYLLEGYREIGHFSPEDLFATECMTLFMLLRFLGKKVHTDANEFFFNLTKKQLHEMDQRY